MDWALRRLGSDSLPTSVATTAGIHPTATGRTGLITGALAVIGYMVACSMPLLAPGSAPAGLCALPRDGGPAAVTLLAAAEIALVFAQRWYAARAKTARSAAANSGLGRQVRGPDVHVRIQ